MALSKAQDEIANCPSRFRVAICGRRFGKTHLAIRELAKYARFPDRKVWYVAPSYRQAKQTVWSKLKKKLRKLNWISTINESDLTIVLKNGSEISLRGSDNYDSLRGVGLNFLVLDEFADIDSQAWYEVLRPTLSDTGGHALFIGTPKGTGNWARDIFENHRTKTGWTSFQFTTIDGGNVPAEEIDQALLDLDERTFRQEYMATFETYAGVISYSFGEHNIKPTPADINTSEIHVGIDFNHTPITAAISVRTNYGLHQFDEIVMNGSNTTELVQEIRTRYPNSRVIVYPDPAGRQRKTSANGNTDFTILANAQFKVLAPQAHDAVKDRINAGNSAFHNPQGKGPKFTIDPRCKHTIKSLQNYCYKEGSQIPDKDSGFDHMFDALTYMIAYLFPVKRTIVERAPERFGVGIR